MNLIATHLNRFDSKVTKALLFSFFNVQCFKNLLRKNDVLKMVERNTIYAAFFFVICLLLIFSTENEKTTEIESFYHEPWRAGKNITENDFIYENDICDPISKFLKLLVNYSNSFHKKKV